MNDIITFSTLGVLFIRCFCIVYFVTETGFLFQKLYFARKNKTELTLRLNSSNVKDFALYMSCAQVSLFTLVSIFK